MDVGELFNVQNTMGTGENHYVFSFFHMTQFIDTPPPPPPLPILFQCRVEKISYSRGVKDGELRRRGAGGGVVKDGGLRRGGGGGG